MNSWHSNQQYPVSVLPPSIQSFILQVCAATQTSPNLVAPVVLSAMSAAVQGIVDIESANGFPMPTSLFFGVVVPSGERKSSVLQHVTPAFEDFEQGRLGTDKEHPFLLEQTTEQGIIDLFREGAKSIFFALPEGGQMLKAVDHSAFCKRFDGATIRHTTRKNGTLILPDTRGAVCMLIQDVTFGRHMSKKGELLIESGFLPRMLMSFPTNQPVNRIDQHTSVIGNENPRTHPFHSRVRALLSDYANLLRNKEQSRQLLLLAPHAHTAWLHFYHYTEHLLSQRHLGGSWADVGAFVKRAGEHALRLAAVLQWFEAPQPNVGQQAMEAAIQIISWHLDEARLAFAEPPLEVQAEQWAEILYGYLWRQYQATGGTAQFARSDLLRCAPTPIRKADRLQAAIHRLINNNRIMSLRHGKKEYISLNLFPPAWPTPLV